jgi:acetyl-CoA acetyltransferase
VPVVPIGVLWVLRWPAPTAGSVAGAGGVVCAKARPTVAAAMAAARSLRVLTLDEYMGARPISDPIHLFDCVMPCAGAEAFLVMREERARELGLPHALVRGAIERHNAYSEDAVMVRGGWRMDRDDLYAQAGAKPADVDFIQTYDDYPVIVMIQFEDLGFCEKGEGPVFVRTHSTTFEGDLPNNTSGGQLSCGQAGAAGGFLGMTETIRQLTGAAGERAVKDARLGLVTGFGMVTYDRCLCTGAVLLGSVK